eukprot:gene1518-1676_t
MNVGKTLSQKILNLGQGSGEENGCLLLSGGDSVTGGTSITMMQKYLEDTTMVVMLNDLRFNRVNAEALLRFHEALYQGSRKEGMGKAKAAAVLISSNEVEESRLEGRVVRFKFVRDENYDKTVGFHLGWIIHHVKLWGKHEKKVCQLLSTIFLRNLRRQQRWVDTLVTIVYTGYLYAATLGKTNTLMQGVEEVVKSELEEGDIGVIQKIELFVVNKIKDNDSHILSWANWRVKVPQKGSGRLVPAIAVKSQELKMCIKERDIKNALQSLTENESSVSTYFSRSEEGCTLQDLQKRNSKTTVNLRAYRFPISEFSETFQHWLDYGLNGGDQPLEEEIGQAISDDERQILLQIEKDIRKDIAENVDFQDNHDHIELSVQGMRVGSKRQLEYETEATDNAGQNEVPAAFQEPTSTDDESASFFLREQLVSSPIKELSSFLLISTYKLLEPRYANPESDINDEDDVVSNIDNGDNGDSKACEQGL